MKSKKKYLEQNHTDIILTWLKLYVLCPKKDGCVSVKVFHVWLSLGVEASLNA